VFKQNLSTQSFNILRTFFLNIPPTPNKKSWVEKDRSGTISRLRKKRDTTCRGENRNDCLQMRKLFRLFCRQVSVCEALGLEQLAKMLGLNLPWGSERG